MNVSNSQPIQQATQIQNQKVQQNTGEDRTPVNASGETGKRKTDEVTLSEQALEMQKLMKQVQETPDVRQEKVAEIKKMLDDGTYKVSPQDIAKKILRSILESE